MTLLLDARQRAMLQEMGVRLFDPLPAADPAPRAVPEVPVAALRAAAPDEATQALPPAAAPRVREPGAVDRMDWTTLADTVAGCRACKLCTTRRNTVFGMGDSRPDWLIVGDAPDEHEDQQGEPFVGPAGTLLDNMLRAVGLNRQHKVFIANALKCRPPANRNPEPEEVAQCEPYLRRQVELLQPRIIVAMGRFAVQSLLQSQEPIGKLRGRAHDYHGVPVVVTYHPAYLLRNLPDKAKAWADLCLAMDVMDGAQPNAPIGR